MMVATPIIWGVAWFGGFASLVSGTALMVQTADNAAPAGTGGLGAIGIVLSLAGVVWWIWGMIDAKNKCEAFNSGSD
jgi:hypothetical protein